MIEKILKATDGDPEAHGTAGKANDALRGAVQELADIAAGLGENIAGVHGTVSDVEAVSAAAAEDSVSISEMLAEMTHSNRSIAAMCAERAEAARQSAVSMQESQSQCVSAIESIDTLADLVTALNDKINAFQARLDEVEQASKQIKSIAAKTHMLSLNASIEANRAGQHGLGFAVVANEVKALANQSAQSNEAISATVATLEKELQKLIAGYQEASEQANAASQGTKIVADAMSEAVNALDLSVDSVQSIASAAEENQAICAEVDDRAKTAASRAQTIESDMKSAVTHLDKLLDASENMMQVTAGAGVTTDDTFYVSAAQNLANECSAALEKVLADGLIDESRLFDRNYRPIANTNPEQFLLNFVDISDRYIQPLLDDALNIDDRIVFCCEIDENGFIATHNSKVSKPQGDDPVWNTGNCRNRRFFKDRAGLKAGQNTKEWQLQTYRRDLGGGNFMIMREANAPIRVRGRIWANVRMGYRLAD